MTVLSVHQTINRPLVKFRSFQMRRARGSTPNSYARFLTLGRINKTHNLCMSTCFNFQVCTGAPDNLRKIGYSSQWTPSPSSLCTTTSSSSSPSSEIMNSIEPREGRSVIGKREGEKVVHIQQRKATLSTNHSSRSSASWIHAVGAEGLRATRDQMCGARRVRKKKKKGQVFVHEHTASRIRTPSLTS